MAEAVLDLVLVDIFGAVSQKAGALLSAFLLGSSSPCADLDWAGGQYYTNVGKFHGQFDAYKWLACWENSTISGHSPKNDALWSSREVGIAQCLTDLHVIDHAYSCISVRGSTCNDGGYKKKKGIINNARFPQIGSGDSGIFELGAQQGNAYKAAWASMKDTTVGYYGYPPTVFIMNEDGSFATGIHGGDGSFTMQMNMDPGTHC